jgi:hypothetical protein
MRAFLRQGKLRKIMGFFPFWMLRATGGALEITLFQAAIPHLMGGDAG